MKIAVIKKLIVEHSLENLKKAEESLLNDEKPTIDVDGEDEGEQLTHLLGAIWILEQINNGMQTNEALRAFTQRVRGSIS